MSGTCSLLTPALPLEEGEKEEKGERLLIGYKTSFTNNTNITNNINNKRNKTKYTKPILSIPELGARVLVSHQQLQGSPRKPRTGLSSRQGLDSGMHGLESGSGSQAGQ